MNSQISKIQGKFALGRLAPGKLALKKICPPHAWSFKFSYEKINGKQENFDFFLKTLKTLRKMSKIKQKTLTKSVKNIPREIPGNLRRIPGNSREKYSYFPAGKFPLPTLNLTYPGEIKFHSGSKNMSVLFRTM